MLHAYVQIFNVTVTMQKFLALFVSKQALNNSLKSGMLVEVGRLG
jgi:hypothetical protein